MGSSATGGVRLPGAAQASGRPKRGGGRAGSGHDMIRAMAASRPATPSAEMSRMTDPAATHPANLDKTACSVLLQQLRWPHGFVCPTCQASDPPWQASRDRLICRACRRHTRLTAGTLMAGTRVPLSTWVEAAWRMVTGPHGPNAVELHRALGVTYHTAARLLHQLRLAMGRAEQNPLAADVTVGATTVDTVSSTAARGHGTHACLVVIALETPDGDDRRRRVKLAHLPAAGPSHLAAFLAEARTDQATVSCDPHADHPLVLQHLPTAAPHDHTPTTCRTVSALLSQWLTDTYQATIDRAYLQAYLDEFAFRWNQPTTPDPTPVFHRLLRHAITPSPPSEPR